MSTVYFPSFVFMDIVHHRAQSTLYVSQALVCRFIWLYVSQQKVTWPYMFFLFNLNWWYNCLRINFKQFCKLLRPSTKQFQSFKINISLHLSSSHSRIKILCENMFKNNFKIHMKYQTYLFSNKICFENVFGFSNITWFKFFNNFPLAR